MSSKLMPQSVSGSSVSYQLSSEQQKSYEENGYLVIRGLLSQQALDSYRQRFQEVCSGRIDGQLVTVLKDESLAKPGVKPEDYINKIQDLLYDEVFSTYSEDPRLLDIVSQLIGDNIMGVGLMLINKPPGTFPHPPHQDTYYLPFRPADSMLATWTAIDPVSRANGALYVVPGTHKYKTLFKHNHQVQESFGLYHGVVNWEAIAPGHGRVCLEMRPGDTVLLNPYIVHGSLPNTAQVYRKSIICHYANSRCQLEEPEGSGRELIAGHMEDELRRRGVQLSYSDLFRIKVKNIRGVKCNL